MATLEIKREFSVTDAANEIHRMVAEKRAQGEMPNHREYSGNPNVIRAIIDAAEQAALAGKFEEFIRHVLKDVPTDPHFILAASLDVTIAVAAAMNERLVRQKEAAAIVSRNEVTNAGLNGTNGIKHVTRDAMHQTHVGIKPYM